MAKKSKRKAARAKLPGVVTTKALGEEGPHPTTLVVGEEQAQLMQVNLMISL